MSASDHGPSATLTADQRQKLHGLLLAAIERARSDLAAMHRDFDTIVDACVQSNADDEHDPEGATIAFERAQVGALIERASAAESAAVEAMRRWDSGRYGRCEICRAPIGYERLRARPATTRCIVHAGS